MLQTIIEYTGFFLVLLFAFGIAASIIIAVWDEFQATKFNTLNALKNKPRNIMKAIRNQFVFKFSGRVKRSGV